MSELKSQLTWLLRGAASTNAALTTLAHDLRALQEKVARIDDELQAERAAGAAKDADAAALRAEIEALKAQLRTAVDDLGDRIGHVTAHSD